MLESLFNKDLKKQLYQKETPTHIFPVKFEKFLRTPTSKNICERLLVNIERPRVKPITLPIRDIEFSGLWP